MGGSYEDQGSPEASTNVNPYTEDILATLMGQLEAGGGGASQLIDKMNNFDFLDILGDERLQGIIGSYAGERGTLAKQAAGNAQRQISGDYAGTALYSGAFGEAVGKGVGEAYQGAATDIAGKQLGLFGQAMGFGAGQQNAQLGYYGQQAAGAAGALGSIGQPDFYEPSYAYEKGPWDYLLDAGGLATTGLSAYFLGKSL